LTKQEFNSALCEWLPESGASPFWCGSLQGNPADVKSLILESGHPLDGKLVVVGYNPSSGVDEPWCCFWNPVTGFDLKKFQECRIAKCKRDGKGRPVSRTRKKIYQLVGQTIGCGSVVVNTNIYWTVSSTAKKLERRDRNFAPIEWLLKKIPHAVIVCHGKPACKKYEKLRCHDCSLPCAIFARHLSRISNEEFQNLVDAISKRLALPRQRNVS
jgi:hypothetical protein